MQTLINAYLDTVQRSRSSKTYSTYKQALQTFLQAVGSDADLTKQTYINFLRKTSDMNPATQALCRSAIKGLYFFQADNDPAVITSFFKQSDKMYALRAGKRLPIFDKDAIVKVIEYCNTMRKDISDLRDRTFILLLADTGLRISEACGLRISDIDFKEQRAVIIGKGDKQAVVHLSNRTMDALRDYLRSRNSHFLSGHVFIRHDKRIGDQIKPVDAGGMWYAVKRRAIEAGVDPKTIRVHDFRHYFVTVVYSASHDIRLAQKLARHESIETTSRYAHLVDDSGEEYDKIFNH